MPPSSLVSRASLSAHCEVRFDYRVTTQDGVNAPQGYTVWHWQVFPTLLRAMRENGIAQRERPIAARLPRPARTPQRILVVSEDSDLRLMYADVLASSGYDVDGTEDGTAGWVALKHARYDLLITENRMPGRTGAYLLQKLLAARMPLPVILLSGLRPTAELRLHSKLSSDAILFKPHTGEELLATVQSTLLAQKLAHPVVRSAIRRPSMTRAIPTLAQWTLHQPAVESPELMPKEEVLKVSGPAGLTAANCGPFGRQVRASMNGHTAIEIDLSRTTSMDCAGLGALIALRKFAHGRNGDMRVANPTPSVQQLFAVVGAGRLFEIMPARIC